MTSLVMLRSDFSLVDIWRKQNPCTVSFTWSNSDRTQASRIDRFFIAKTAFNKISSCQILPCVLDLSLEGIVRRGTGVWRFNNSLLSNADFKTTLKCVIVDFKLKILNFPLLRHWWDSLKIDISKATVNFSVRERRLQNQNRIVRTKRLIRAKNSSQRSAVINDLEGQLCTLISKDAEGEKIRS